MKEKRMSVLKGKLSYTLAALAVLGAVAGYLLGWTDSSEAIKIIWTGLALFGVRRAIQ